MGGADDHLAELILLGGEHIGRLLSTDVLSALSDLPAGKASRLEATLAALLRSMNRSAPEVATTLGIHPQTARYRMRQLEGLFGDRLADPDFRFAAELVLRGRILRRGTSPNHR
jgi:DNA-binding PucR family transcriptional regulator